IQPVELKKKSRHRRSNDVGNWNRRHEDGDHFCPVLISKPVTEVHNDSGKETGFRCAEQKPQEVKLILRVDESHPDRDHTPRDHDARNPAACAPLLDENASWNFEKEIAEKENAGTEAQHIIGEGEIAFHLKLSVTEIDA